MWLIYHKFKWDCCCCSQAKWNMVKQKYEFVWRNECKAKFFFLTCSTITLTGRWLAVVSDPVGYPGAAEWAQHSRSSTSRGLHNLLVSVAPPGSLQLKPVSFYLEIPFHINCIQLSWGILSVCIFPCSVLLLRTRNCIFWKKGKADSFKGVSTLGVSEFRWTCLDPFSDISGL